MRKIVFIVLGIILYCIPVRSQNGWKEEGLHGYILMLKQRCHEVIETPRGYGKGAIISFCLVGNENYIFDRKGRITEKLAYDESNKLEWESTYTYESNNKANILTKKACGSFKSQVTYIYNDLGEIIEETIYNAQGDVIDKYVHLYDEQGINRISTSCYRVGGSLKWREVYEYDHLGNKLAYRHYDSQGNLDWYTMYKYDNLGNKIEEGSYDFFENELSYHTYEYVYDDWDNWIQQTVFSFDLNKRKYVDSIISREIIYY